MGALALALMLPARRRRRPGISGLARIFATGDLGTLLDSTKAASMYLESTGVTPMTADGQPLGLWLDSRYNLVRGAQLWRAPDAATGWTTSATVVVRDATGIQFTAANNSSFADCITLTANGPTVADESYELEFDVTGYVGGTLRTIIYGAAGNQQFATGPNITANGHYRYICHLAAGGSQNNVIKLQSTGTSGTNTFKVSNLSCRSVHGRHAIQATAGLRPLRAPGVLVDYDGVDDLHNLTFPGASGSSWTVGRALSTGPDVLLNQTIGTTFTNNVDCFLLFIINRALTVGEMTTLVDVLSSRSGVSDPFGFLLDENGDFMTDENGDLLLG